jgi:Domain of unknown function (DUF4426)
MTLRSIHRFVPWLAAGLFLVISAGCNPGDVPGKPQAGAPAEPTSQEFGDFVLHYNAIRSDQLDPGVARAYSIERSANRVMLNVALLRKRPDGRTEPVDGEVSATAYNLNGQLKDLQMRRISEGSSVYYVGETGISGSEILVFNIQASPAGQSEKFAVQFKREFFAD